MWIDDSNYKEYLKGISIVEVSGESCANCLTLMPILDRLVSNRKDCNLYHIEVSEKSRSFIDKYDIRQVPTIMILNDQELYVSCRGYQPEEILEIWLDKKIEELKNIRNKA